MKEFIVIWAVWMGFTPSIAAPAQIHPEISQLAHVMK